MKIIMQNIKFKRRFCQTLAPLCARSPRGFLRYTDIHVDMVWFGVDRFECLSYTELKIAYEFSNHSL